MSEFKPSIALRIAWTSGQLPSAAAKVLLALASCGDFETGERCFPNWDTLSARSGLSRATVARALAWLKNKTQPGGPWIRATAWRHRHSVTYDICIGRLATRPVKEQQVSLTALLSITEFGSQIETQTSLGSQIETQEPDLGSQIETPTSTPDLDLVRTHTPRAREGETAGEPEPELALLGQPPPARCAHPYRHAWCEGRVHVPRDLHFELLDRLGTRAGETRAEKVGRLVAFYADTMAHLSSKADVPNAYTFWNGAYQAWVGTGARRRGEPRRADGMVYGASCAHDPMCETRHACIDRMLAEARAERERRVG